MYTVKGTTYRGEKIEKGNFKTVEEATEYINDLGRRGILKYGGIVDDEALRDGIYEETEKEIVLHDVQKIAVNKLLEIFYEDSHVSTSVLEFLNNNIFMEDVKNIINLRENENSLKRLEILEHNTTKNNGSLSPEEIEYRKHNLTNDIADAKQIINKLTNEILSSQTKFIYENKNTLYERLLNSPLVSNAIEQSLISPFDLDDVVKNSFSSLCETIITNTADEKYAELENILEEDCYLDSI